MFEPAPSTPKNYNGFHYGTIRQKGKFINVKENYSPHLQPKFSSNSFRRTLEIPTRIRPTSVIEETSSTSPGHDMDDLSSESNSSNSNRLMNVGNGGSGSSTSTVIYSRVDSKETIAAASNGPATLTNGAGRAAAFKRFEPNNAAASPSSSAFSDERLKQSVSQIEQILKPELIVDRNLQDMNNNGNGKNNNNNHHHHHLQQQTVNNGADGGLDTLRFLNLLKDEMKSLKSELDETRSELSKMQINYASLENQMNDTNQKQTAEIAKLRKKVIFLLEKKFLDHINQQQHQQQAVTRSSRATTSKRAGLMNKSKDDDDDDEASESDDDLQLQNSSRRTSADDTVITF